MFDFLIRQLDTILLSEVSFYQGYIMSIRLHHSLLSSI